LLDTFLYAGVVGQGAVQGFSAVAGQRKSHFGDHERILREIDEQIAVIAPTGGDVPQSCVDLVHAAWRQHEKYDQTYVEPLADAIARGAAA
jgi:hypothetical protein